MAKKIITSNKQGRTKKKCSSDEKHLKNMHKNNEKAKKC